MGKSGLKRDFGGTPKQVIFYFIAPRSHRARKRHAISIGRELLVRIADNLSLSPWLVRWAGRARRQSETHRQQQRTKTERINLQMKLRTQYSIQNWMVPDQVGCRIDLHQALNGCANIVWTWSRCACLMAPHAQRPGKPPVYEGRVDMCFSAPASFTVAAATGLVGALAVRKVTSWREIPLATIPLMFALQQTVEGTLWILLARDDQATMVVPFANIFASFALIAWPVWAPLSALLVEPARVRQLGMVVLFILAVPIAFIGLRDISAHPYSVCVVGRSLSYSNGTAYSLVELSAYAVCVCCPLLLSTHRMLRMFGAIVVFGLPVSAAFYYVTSFSVWCFFAAAGSVTIYLYFSTAPKVAPTPLSA